MKGKGKGVNLGMVTSRKCPYCGHSEIGYTTQDGTFHSLKPGALIRVAEIPEDLSSDTGGKPILDDFADEEEVGQGEFRPWVPTVLKGDKRLRVKYGVMVREKVALRGLTGSEYRSAFLRKIEKLIEKAHTPLPVIFDKFFAAPHLASGNPGQISEALWRELEEIRNPILAVGKWIEQQSQESLLRMIHPKSMADLVETPVSDKDLEAELQSLTLEQFLEML